MTDQSVDAVPSVADQNRPAAPSGVRAIEWSKLLKPEIVEKAREYFRRSGSAAEIRSFEEGLESLQKMYGESPDNAEK
jgi:hypothetical protein